MTVQAVTLRLKESTTHHPQQSGGKQTECELYRVMPGKNGWKMAYQGSNGARGKSHGGEGRP